MTSKYYQRNFVQDHFYPLYNRGAYKQHIFRNNADYLTFIDILKYYLNFPSGQALSRLALLKVPNLSEPSEQPPVELHAYCLMPNHFHLLVKQSAVPSRSTNITNLMRRLSITYSMYFQETYHHSGQIFQGKYKNILIDSESYFLHLSRYIHLNPLEIHPPHPQQPLTWLATYPFSSYPEYLHPGKHPWVTTNTTLSHFGNSSHLPSLKSYNTYRSFVESQAENSAAILQDLTLETN